MTITLLVADIAGTTVRDDGIVEAAFTDAMAVVGVGPDDSSFPAAVDIVRSTMGQSKIVVFNQILNDEMAASHALAAFEMSIARRIDAGEVEPLPGAVDALRQVRELGCQVALTTGFGDETRELLIDHLGWRDLVDLSISPSTHLRGRPAPDMILAAVMTLGIDSVRHVATVGDTVSDLESGWNAGASIVAGVLTGAHVRAELEAAPHTHVIDSIADLPPLLATD